MKWIFFLSFGVIFCLNAMATELLKYNLVEFPSQGSIIGGRLYLPETRPPTISHYCNGAWIFCNYQWNDCRQICRRILQDWFCGIVI